MDAKDKKGGTPLHLAAFSSSLETMKCLVENGASLKAKDENGNTPLHIAASKGFLEIVKYLVQQGAHFDIINKQNYTAFDLANQNIYQMLNPANREHYIEVAKYLLELKRESYNKNPPNNLNDKALCIVCFAPRNGLFVLLPCGHMSLCEPCCYMVS